MTDIPEWAMEKAREVARLSVERPYNKGTVQRAAEVIARALLQADQEATERAAKNRLRFDDAKGLTLEAMRANIPRELRNSGDCVLVWVNEGDITMLQMNGIASAIREGRQG